MSIIILLALCVLPGRAFPSVPLDHIASGKYAGPRATVEGAVIFTRKEEDGDIHLKLVSTSSLLLICEIIPELPLPAPQVNDKIEIWGIVRYDRKHKWWELHPVIGWRKK